MRHRRSLVSGVGWGWGARRLQGVVSGAAFMGRRESLPQAWCSHTDSCSRRPQPGRPQKGERFSFSGVSGGYCVPLVLLATHLPRVLGGRVWASPAPRWSPRSAVKAWSCVSKQCLLGGPGSSTQNPSLPLLHLLEERSCEDRGHDLGGWGQWPKESPEDSCGPWETRVLLDSAVTAVRAIRMPRWEAGLESAPALDQRRRCLDGIPWERSLERRSCGRYHRGVL